MKNWRQFANEIWILKQFLHPLLKNIASSRSVSKVSSKKVVFAMLRTGSIELYYCVLKEKHLKRETSWSRLLSHCCENVWKHCIGNDTAELDKQAAMTNESFTLQDKNQFWGIYRLCSLLKPNSWMKQNNLVRRF